MFAETGATVANSGVTFLWIRRKNCAGHRKGAGHMGRGTMGTEHRGSSFGRLLCLIRGHNIDRLRVWHDGFDHRTTCRRCGSPLIKDSEEWRPFSSDTDMDPRRKPHPHYTESDT